MNNAIILHGKPSREEYYSPAFPSASNAHWIPWLQKQLVVQGFAAQTPEIPNAWNPDYQTWCREFERYDITPQTLLVGHSCGGGFLVRWLSEHTNITVGTVVLVAPSLGIDWDAKDFFDFTIDATVASRTNKLVIFVSDDDRPAIHQAVQTLQTAIPGIIRQDFRGYGHFCFDDMKTVEFPQLRDTLVS